MSTSSTRFGSTASSQPSTTTAPVASTSASASKDNNNSSSNWPPSLKTFVNQTFAKCTDANRAVVEAELKTLILRGFQAGTLWTTDWANTQLESLNPKKRKAFVPSTYSQAVAVPSSSSAFDEDSRRDKRAKRFTHANSTSFSSPGSAAAFVPAGGFSRTVPSTISRFSSNYSFTTPEPEPVYDPNVLDWDKDTVVGTCQKLEKPYLRLTSLPDPATIRPLPVLRQTLELLKRKWREEQNFAFISDQFKSMRQDLTVQRIKNDFTCTVYEIHARIALEKGDLGEFNQCQAQLKELYRANLPGNRLEFLGYQILYLVYSRNKTEMNALVASLSDSDLQDRSVVHALAVRNALAQGSYTRFFRLFCEAPKMGAYIIDHFVERERISALLTMSRAYQHISCQLIERQLAFDNEEEVEKFLDRHGVAIYATAPSITSRAVNAKAVAGILAEARAKFLREGKKRAGEA